MQPDAPLLQVHNLAKRFHARQALTDFSLTLHAGEIIGLVGANGGGKTTSLRLLAGLMRSDTGSGVVLGCNIMDDTSPLREKTGYMTQHYALYGTLTVYENILARARMYGLAEAKSAVNALLAVHGLTPFADTPVAALSGGWMRRAQFAACVIHHPSLLLLDEPTAGLDQTARKALWQHMRHLAQRGTGIVISTHDLTEAEICTRVAVYAEGRIVTIDTPQAIVSKTGADFATSIEALTQPPMELAIQ